MQLSERQMSCQISCRCDPNGPLKTIRVGAMLLSGAQKASGSWTCFKKAFSNGLSHSHYHVLKVTRAFKRSHLQIFENIGHSFVCVKSGQIIFKDAIKIRKGGVIGIDIWILPFVFILSIAKGFPCFCNNVINCRLDIVNFSLLIDFRRIPKGY